MIRGRGLCVSCYNRARELERGRNGRGNAPIELQARAPRPFDIIVSVDGDARRIRSEVTGLQELMVRTLQATKGDVAFAFAGPRIQRRADLDLTDSIAVGQDEPSVDDGTDHGELALATTTRRQAVLKYRGRLFASAARTPIGGQGAPLAAARRACGAWVAGPLRRAA